MPLIRKELTEFVEEHNSHRIRKQRDRLTPQGIPEDLYQFPENYGTVYSLYFSLKAKFLYYNLH